MKIITSITRKKNERVYLQHNLLIRIIITNFGNNRIWNDKNYNIEFVSNNKIRIEKNYII